MTNDDSRATGRREAEEWEAVFADSDPTRVLPSNPPQRAADSEVSAVRYQQVATPAPAPQAQSQPQPTPLPEPAGRRRDEGSLGSGRVEKGISPYHRIQFIPAFLGALLAYGVLSIYLQLASSAAQFFGARTYPTPTGATLDLLKPESRSAALPWAIILAAGVVLAFALAGYAAARMSAVAPAKQAVGVLLATLFGLLLGSLLTWLTASTQTPLTPQFSGHSFLAADFGVGALTLAALLLLALIAALLGALAGRSYHRKLAQSTQPVG